MKTTTLFVACCALVLFLSSCSKKPEQTQEPRKVSWQSMAKAADVKHWESGFKDCYTPAPGCGPEVVVTPSKESEMGGAMAAGATGVGSYFSSTNGLAFAALFDIDGQDLTNLQSGTYNVIRESSGSVSQRFYYLVGPASTLTSENPEYVLQCSH